MTEPSTIIQRPDEPAHTAPLGRWLWPAIRLLVHAHNPRQQEAIERWMTEGRDCAFVAGRIHKAMQGSAVYFERARKLYEDQTGLRLHALGRTDWKRAVLRVALEKSEFTLLDRLLWDEDDAETLWVLRTALGVPTSDSTGSDFVLLRFAQDGSAKVEAALPPSGALHDAYIVYRTALLQGQSASAMPVPCASVIVGGFVVPRPELGGGLART